MVTKNSKIPWRKLPSYQYLHKQYHISSSAKLDLSWQTPHQWLPFFYNCWCLRRLLYTHIQISGPKVALSHTHEASRRVTCFKAASFFALWALLAFSARANATLSLLGTSGIWKRLTLRFNAHSTRKTSSAQSTAKIYIHIQCPVSCNDRCWHLMPSKLQRLIITFNAQSAAKIDTDL